jgi:hypothetical protein
MSAQELSGRRRKKPGSEVWFPVIVAKTSLQVTRRGLELADRLEGLLQLPLAGPADVEPWINACGEVRVWLDANTQEMPFELPTYLMFYFHDPDIRAKESDYKVYQETAVRGLIRQLRGESPPHPTRS